MNEVFFTGPCGWLWGISRVHPGLLKDVPQKNSREHKQDGHRYTVCYPVCCIFVLKYCVSTKYFVFTLLRFLKGGHGISQVTSFKCHGCFRTPPQKKSAVIAFTEADFNANFLSQLQNFSRFNPDTLYSQWGDWVRDNREIILKPKHFFSILYCLFLFWRWATQIVGMSRNNRCGC